MESISSSFDFIKQYETEIYSKSKEAEQLYCEKHFASSANFSRQLLELILKQYLSSSPELKRYYSKTLKDCIENLEYLGCCGKKIISTMHEIRILGNKASHTNDDFSKDDAYRCLSRIFEVSIWYLNKKGITTDTNLIYKDPLYKTTEKNDICKAAVTSQLTQSFENFELTNSQSQLVKKLENFLSYENHHEVFILKGYAGTGKTFIVNGIIKYLNKIDRDFMLMAPTGKAASVLEKSSNSTARTIHSSIYVLHNLNDFPIDNQENSSVYKLYFELGYNDFGSDCVFIVDESSMISNFRAEMETTVFGTGKLLDDLFEFINFDHNDHHKKIIFIGDPAQLPPIGYDINIGSPALNKEYLSKTYNVNTDCFELSDVVRQKSNNAILKTSLGLRNSINKKCYSTINFVFKPMEVERIDVNLFINKYSEFLDNKTVPDDTIVVARTNAEVLDYNNTIRQIIFSKQLVANQYEKLPLQVNERLLCVKNTRTNIKNGSLLELCILKGDVETFNIKFKRRNHEGEIEEISRQLSFQDAEIKSEDGTRYEEKLLLNLLYNAEPYLKPIDQQALYIFFRARNNKISPKDPLFKQALLDDPYFNAIQVKFGYALTGHKAQGGEWKNVFIAQYGQNKQNEYYFRWLYTAVTRAKQRLIVIGRCNMNVLSGAEIK